jgi:hypothetical protein
MRELLELKTSEEEARQYLPPGIGKTLPMGLVRQLLLDVGDPLVERLRSLEAEHRARGTTLFTLCEVSRRYTPRELLAAEFLKVEFWPFFQPTGEECGTEYDESTAYPCCGVGARQMSPLHLELRRIPKSRDIALSMGGEYVISQRLARALEQHRITGYQLQPIFSKGGRPTEDWFQLIIPSDCVEMVPPTRFGSDYLAPEPDSSRCPQGHVAGHQLISPVHISRDSLNGNDWAFTRQRLGLRMGLIRPYPLMIISQRLYQLLKEMKVRNLHAEIAHLV